jgi:hypothetical protein
VVASFLAKVEATSCGQLVCPRCRCNLLACDRDGLPAETRLYIDSFAYGELVVSDGPRESCHVVLVRDGETFRCPGCRHEVVAVLDLLEAHRN